ncbi:MAG: heat shock 70 family protein [archaeon]|nr:heat shock 70 family protein [archaeon]
MEKETAPAIGIDLGTTFSCVAAWNNGIIDVIPNLMGNRTTPSIVSFGGKDILVGEAARDQAIKNPLNTIHSIKRIIGRQYNDPHTQEDLKKFKFKVEKGRSIGNSLIKVFHDGKERTYVPEQISAYVLKNLKASAEEVLGKKVTKAVITVPAYFNDAQRQSTKDAGSIAGLEVLELLSEPTAAALAYGLLEKIDSTKKVLVFDFGGGTLDVTILEIDEGIFDVLCTYGDSNLGGEDLTNALVDFCIKNFEEKNKCVFDRTNARALWRVKNECERAKIALSSENSIEVEVLSLMFEQDLRVEITKAKFEDLCKNYFIRCSEVITEALRKKNVKKDDIEEIVLVGGSSRVPKVKELIKDYFNGKNINDKINPDESVAYGAAIEAAKLSHVQDDTLMEISLCDVCPQCYGIAAYKGGSDKETMSKIILNNSQIPIQKTEEYTTRDDFQTQVNIKIYQGNYDDLSQDYYIGNFLLTGLPPKKKGEVKIEVTFEIDTNSILNVTAVEKNGPKKKKITIVDNKMNLKENEIEEFRKEAESFRASPNPDLDVFSMKNINDKISKLELLYNKSQNKEEKSNYAQSLALTLEDTLNETINNGIENMSVYENFMYRIKKLFYYFNSICELGFISEEEQERILIKVKGFLDIIRNEKLDDIYDLLEMFKNTKKVFDVLILQVVRFEFNEALKLANKKDFLRSKKILQKCQSILNYYDFPIKVMFHKVDGEISDEYNDLKESISFYMCRSNAGILMKEADDYLNLGLTGSDDLDMDKIYLALDKYKEALKEVLNSNESTDVELEAMCLSAICKIQFKILKSTQISSIKDKIRNCMRLAESLRVNLETLKWFRDAKQIFEEIQSLENKIEDETDENFKEKLITEKPEIFNKINEYAGKSNVEFLKFILQEHPYDGYKPSNNIEADFKKNPRIFVRKLKGKYNPRYLKKETYEERVKYTIYHVISCKLNDLFSNDDPEQKTER